MFSAKSTAPFSPSSGESSLRRTSTKVTALPAWSVVRNPLNILPAKRSKVARLLWLLTYVPPTVTCSPTSAVRRPAVNSVALVSPTSNDEVVTSGALMRDNSTVPA